MRSGRTRGLSSSSSSSSCARAGYADCRCDRAKVTCFVHRADRSRDHGRYARLSQIQHNMFHCGILDWIRVQAKNWTCHPGSIWIQSSVIPKFCICGMENRIGTSPVSGWNIVVLSENEQNSFPDKFLSQSWQTQKTHCRDRILS